MGRCTGWCFLVAIAWVGLCGVCQSFLGGICWVRFPGLCSLVHVYWVRFARSDFLSQLCWLRFAWLEFTGFGVGVWGGGYEVWFRGYVGWNLLSWFAGFSLFSFQLIGLCWLARSGFVGQVYWVRFARPGSLSQVCWVRFAGLRFTGFGAGVGGLLGSVCWGLLCGIYHVCQVSLVCWIEFACWGMLWRVCRVRLLGKVHCVRSTR